MTKNKKMMITVPVGATPKITKARDGLEVIKYDHYSASIHINYSTLDSVIETLTSLRNKYAKTYSNLCIKSKRDCGCYHDCSCSPTYYVVGQRLENDDEYQSRIRSEELLKVLREQRERKEYEELKAKFEKN